MAAQIICGNVSWIAIIRLFRPFANFLSDFFVKIYRSAFLNVKLSLMLDSNTATQQLRA